MKWYTYIFTSTTNDIWVEALDEMPAWETLARVLGLSPNTDIPMIKNHYRITFVERSR
jgi:hypothetical protein